MVGSLIRVCRFSGSCDRVMAMDLPSKASNITTDAGEYVCIKLFTNQDIITGNCLHLYGLIKISELYYPVLSTLL